LNQPRCEALPDGSLLSVAKSKPEILKRIPTACANLRPDLNPRASGGNEPGISALHFQLCALHGRGPTRFVERLEETSVEAERWIV
jgi:hypothetical protein